MSKKVFKTQKEYIRYLRWRQRTSRIIAVFSVILLFLYIVLENPYRITAWVIFAGYALLMAILDYHAKQELLKKDTETANKETQASIAEENKKRIRKHM